jgi:hypothetical protein
MGIFMPLVNNSKQILNVHFVSSWNLSTVERYLICICLPTYIVHCLLVLINFRVDSRDNIKRRTWCFWYTRSCLLFAFEYVPHMGSSQQIKYLRLYFNVSFLKLNKRVSNITRFCRPLPRKFLFKKCHIYINTIEWKCISVNVLRMMVIVVIM